MENKQLVELIFRNIVQGKIDKDVGVDLLDRLKRTDSAYGKDIAVIGLAIKAPCALNKEEFWENLKEGRDCIRSFPESREADIAAYLRDIKGDSNIEFKSGAYLDNIDKFDYKFFRISPKEASLMSPNQRLFLQTSWEAIEDAGYGGDRLSGTKTGVYVGFSADELYDYKSMIMHLAPSATSSAATGNFSSIIAGRISYILNLRGPSIIIDTACSSSLVAVHMACRALQSGDCSMALAGGVRINLMNIKGEFDIGIHSADGITRTFDEGSEGTNGGEGIGVVMLKPLAAAIRDRDNIYAVIKGSAVNQDGSSIGITAPNAIAQEEVIVQAWENAGINPETLSYIEAHGTGTRLGDTVEIAAITRAFSRYTDKKQFCAIGSLKTNLGHLDQSSGIFGLIKSILVLKNKEIPPIKHFNRPNKEISFQASPVYVNNELTSLKDESSPIRCGVSAFGISGTNCHIVLEEYKRPAPDNISRTAGGLNVLTISAKSLQAVKRLIVSYYEFVRSSDVNIQDMCYTANTGRGQYNFRLAVVFDSLDDLLEKLSCICSLDDLHSINKKDIYFGEFRIVPDNKSDKKEFEFTEEQLESFGDTVNEIVNECEELSYKCLTEICKLYIKGAAVNWAAMYKSEQRNKISLPVYPFDEYKCWIQPEYLDNISEEIPESCFLHKTHWELSKLDNSNKKPLESILVFRSSGSKGQHIAEKLKEHAKSIVEVNLGDEYKMVSARSYTIRNCTNDYIKLLNDIGMDKIDTIIHMLTLDMKGITDDIKELKNRENLGAYSFFRLIKALGQYGGEVTAGINIISEYVDMVDGSEDRINPENSALYGLAKVAEWENANLTLKCIDVDDMTSESSIIAELEADSPCFKVAYRNDKRYVELLKNVEAGDISGDSLAVTEGGVYVITGGTGAIGLKVARYLALKNNIKLVLISRRGTSNNGKRLEAIEEIKKLGSEVYVYSTDTADFDNMEAVIKDVREKLGLIRGVIVAAGTGGGTLVSIENEENIAKIFGPKIEGAWIADKLTQDDDLDFFISFSSAITLTGGLGGGAYTAANSYLDSFAAYRRMNGKRALTVNWPIWYDTGLSKGVASFEERQLFKTIKPEKAMEVFDIAVKSSLNNIIIGEINYESGIFGAKDRLPFDMHDDIKSKISARKSGNKRKKSESGRVGSRVRSVILHGRDKGDYTDTEIKVANIWAEAMGFTEVDIYDNFYEIGGDSIIAMKIINAIKKKMGISIEVSDFFRNLNIISFSECIDNIYLSGTNRENVLPPIEHAAKKESYGLSSPQKRLFILNQIEKNGIHYNEPAIMRVEGPLDRQRFENAIGSLLRRHEILRTSFDFADGEPVQIVHDNISFNIDYIECSEQEADRLIRDFIQPFQLDMAPLIRVKLIQLEKYRHIMMFDMHHIICDAASIQILLQDFINFYLGIDIPELKLQYKDYSEWQKKLLETDLLKKQGEYWLGLFSDKIPELKLYTDFERPNIKSYKGDKVSCVAERHLAGKIRNCAVELGATPFMVLLGAYYILLHKYSSSEDIVVGSPILGRPQADLENLIGVFVNTLPLRNKPEPDKTIKAFMEEVISNSLKAYANQDYQLEVLVDDLGIGGRLDSNPLFNVGFTLQKVNIRRFSAGDLEFYPYEFEHNIARFDIALLAAEADGKFHFTFEYSTDLFKRITIEAMAKHYLKVLDYITGGMDLKIKDIRLNMTRVKNSDSHIKNLEFNF